MLGREVEEIKSLLRQLVENTKPAGIGKRVIDSIVAIVTISGAITVIDQIIKWFRG